MTATDDRRLLLVTTGGTIGSEASARSGGVAPSGATAGALHHFLASRSRVPIEHVPFASLLSSQMTLDHVLELADALGDRLARETVAGAVVTHGTDTLEETAFALAVLLTTEKPVVLTGAQRSFDAPDYDGYRNLADAIAVALSPAARGRGPLVCFGGAILDAHGATKIDTYDLEGFGAFTPRGHIGDVAAGAPRFVQPPRPRPGLASRRFVPVELVTATLGSAPGLLRAALAGGARGIVVEAMGTGNLPGAYAQAIRDAIAAGVPVVIASRCPSGSATPLYAGPGAGVDLAAAGAIFSGALSGPKARLLLSLALGADGDRGDLRRLFADHDPAGAA